MSNDENNAPARRVRQEPTRAITYTGEDTRAAANPETDPHAAQAAAEAAPEEDSAAAPRARGKKQPHQPESKE